jgi:hypothetical protein
MARRRLSAQRRRPRCLTSGRTRSRIITSTAGRGRIEHGLPEAASVRCNRWRAAPRAALDMLRFVVTPGAHAGCRAGSVNTKRAPTAGCPQATDAHHAPRRSPRAIVKQTCARAGVCPRSKGRNNCSRSAADAGPIHHLDAHAAVTTRAWSVIAVPSLCAGTRCRKVGSDLLDLRVIARHGGRSSGSRS